MLDRNDLNSMIDMQKDIVSHNADDLGYIDKIFKSDVFSKAEIDDINNAFKKIIHSELDETKKADLLENSWKINFTHRIPTPEEFITSEDWIGPTASSIFPYIKDAFCKFFNPNLKYRQLNLYYPIGTGKTTLVALIKIYVSIIDYYLRNPKQFFKLSQATVLTDVSVSLTKEQTYSLIIKPMLNIMGTSPKFEKLKFENDMDNKRRENPNKIFLANTSKGSSMIRIGDLYFNTVAEPSQLLGLTIQTLSLTELAFLTEVMPEDTVMRLLNDGKQRVYSRFGNHYLARTIVDSSPNSLENAVDRYIYRDSRDDDTILFLNDTKWNLQPNLFPLWEKSKETFPVYKGSVAKPPKILNKDEEGLYDINDIVEMPIDIKQFAKDALPKVLKDWAGVPSAGNDERLISNFDIIENSFTKSLRNEYAFIHAPASKPPEGLLWDIFKNKFWTYTGRGNLYTFYRNPKAPRFVSVDLAKKHDMATISMSHLESNLQGEKIYVVDFSIAVMSTTNDEINMDSFKFFITDMMKYGGINILNGSYDGFQSDTTIQYFKRIGFNFERLSVDLSMEPYLSLISYMSQGRVRMGRNLIAKNNFKSLTKTTTHDGKGDKPKIDHVKGEWCDLDNMDWNISRMGYFGKDLSDSICASIALCDMYGTLTADYIYRFDEEKEENTIEHGYDMAINDLSSKYGLEIA